MMPLTPSTTTTSPNSQRCQPVGEAHILIIKCDYPPAHASAYSLCCSRSGGKPLDSPRGGRLKISIEAKSLPGSAPLDTCSMELTPLPYRVAEIPIAHLTRDWHDSSEACTSACRSWNPCGLTPSQHLTPGKDALGATRGNLRCHSHGRS